MASTPQPDQVFQHGAPHGFPTSFPILHPITTKNALCCAYCQPLRSAKATQVKDGAFACARCYKRFSNLPQQVQQPLRVPVATKGSATYKRFSNLHAPRSATEPVNSRPWRPRWPRRTRAAPCALRVWYAQRTLSNHLSIYGENTSCRPTPGGPTAGSAGPKQKLVAMPVSALSAMPLSVGSLLDGVLCLESQRSSEYPAEISFFAALMSGTVSLPAW
jgi:hypothetical protein